MAINIKILDLITKDLKRTRMEDDALILSYHQII